MQQAYSLTKRHWRIATVLVGLLVLSFSESCNKSDADAPQELSVRGKLLGRWQRNFLAYDKNQNRVIDSSEEYHSATDTVILQLLPNNEYVRTQMYRGVGYDERGTWHLQAADKEMVLQPTTSTTRIDTLKLDTVALDYFRYHTDTSIVWNWGAFIRPR